MRTRWRTGYHTSDAVPSDAQVRALELVGWAIESGADTGRVIEPRVVLRPDPVEGPLPACKGCSPRTDGRDPDGAATSTENTTTAIVTPTPRAAARPAPDQREPDVERLLARRAMEPRGFSAGGPVAQEAIDRSPSRYRWVAVPAGSDIGWDAREPAHGCSAHLTKPPDCLAPGVSPSTAATWALLGPPTRPVVQSSSPGAGCTGGPAGKL